MAEKAPSRPGDRLPPWLPPDYQPGRETPADINDRSAPFLIDAAFVTGLMFALVSLNGLVGDQPAVAVVLCAAVLLCYSPLCTARWGGTPGKLMREIRVARADDGANLSYGQALRRHLAHWVLCVVPVGPLHHLWIIWDEPRQQCLHDKFAKTIVVIRE